MVWCSSTAGIAHATRYGKAHPSHLNPPQPTPRHPNLHPFRGRRGGRTWPRLLVRSANVLSFPYGSPLPPRPPLPSFSPSPSPSAPPSSSYNLSSPFPFSTLLPIFSPPASSSSFSSCYRKYRTAKTRGGARSFPAAFKFCQSAASGDDDADNDNVAGHDTDDDATAVRERHTLEYLFTTTRPRETSTNNLGGGISGGVAANHMFPRFKWHLTHPYHTTQPHPMPCHNMSLFPPYPYPCHSIQHHIIPTCNPSHSIPPLSIPSHSIVPQSIISHPNPIQSHSSLSPPPSHPLPCYSIPPTRDLHRHHHLTRSAAVAP